MIVINAGRSAVNLIIIETKQNLKKSAVFGILNKYDESSGLGNTFLHFFCHPLTCHFNNSSS